MTCLTLAEAAAELRFSRRRLVDWLKAHPVDGYGQPFYAQLGRVKSFDEHDLGRIREALKEQQKCRSSSSRGRARRSTTSAGSTSEQALTELQRRLPKPRRQGSSKHGHNRSSAGNIVTGPWRSY